MKRLVYHIREWNLSISVILGLIIIITIIDMIENDCDVVDDVEGNGDDDEHHDHDYGEYDDGWW